MKFNRLLLSLCILTVSACGQMKQFFPDKEKDYQLTSEISELVVPEDLSGNKVKKKSVAEINEPVESISRKEAKETIAVDLIEDSEGIKRIRIEDTSRRSWRIVGKALSHQAIEIVDRDALDNVYFVQYDPEFKKIEDGSLWDEFLFIFGDDPAKEKEFAVKLVKKMNYTEVVVHDHNDIPVSEGAGEELLKKLYQTIKEDLSD